MRKGSYSEELVKIVVDACQGVRPHESTNRWTRSRIHLRVENPMKTCHKPPQNDA